MTITSPLSTISYVGNGSTVSFPFAFPILNSTHIIVTLTDTAQTPAVLTTLSASQYNVSGIGSPLGGTVTLSAPLAAGVSLTIRRLVPYVQTTSIVNQGGFYPDVLENALDYLTMEVQQLADQAARTVVVPVGSGLDPSSYLTAVQTAATDAGTMAANAASAALASATYSSTSLNALSAAQSSALSASAYASTCLAALASVQSGALTTTQINTLPATWLAGLSTTTVHSLTATALGAISTTQIGLIQSTQMGALSSTQLNGLSAAGMTGVSVASAAAFFKNLKIQVTSNTAATVSADLVQMANASGATISKAVSSTIGTGATGLNGLDTGTVAASTWYYVWAVSNGTTTGVVLSTSSTAPNSAITATYPYYARIGALRTAATAVLMATVQYGRRVQYVVGGVNVANLPIMSSGAQGSPTTPTWVAVSVSTFVPATAFVIVGVVATGNGYTFMAAPNNSYGTANSTTNPPPVAHVPYSGETGLTETFSFVLESTNIYWAVAGAGSLACLGWEDNL